MVSQSVNNHAIIVNHITKDYGNGKGVFDLTFHVKKGEVMGFLGPNGAGKTTTIRQLLGFIRPQSGNLSILGKDCFHDSHLIHASLGYLPGEIAFMDNMSGDEFLRFMAKYQKCKSMEKVKELQELFNLDASGRIRKMSKGMKQKIGIICAFMADPDILILDEPTSGLDPLMQNKFIELILREKQRGKTILMSSHIFDEIERTCDRTAIIRAGKLIAVEEMSQLSSNRATYYEIAFQKTADAVNFKKQVEQAKIAHCSQALHKSESLLEVQVYKDINQFLQYLTQYEIKNLTSRNETLEEMFLHFYGEENSSRKENVQ